MARGIYKNTKILYVWFRRNRENNSNHAFCLLILNGLKEERYINKIAAKENKMYLEVMFLKPWKFCWFVFSGSRERNFERFPFTKKIRKFRSGCKWNTTFWFVPLEIFRNKRNFWKGSPVFPMEISQWKICVPFTNFLSYHQFHAFRGLLSGQASLEWDL